MGKIPRVDLRGFSLEKASPGKEVSRVSKVFAPKPILLAEDEEHDVFFMRQAFRQAGVAIPIQGVADGAEAIEYLAGTGQYIDRARFPLPCVLLTDIKVPKVDGFELLAWLQGQPQFADLPKIVLSSSCLKPDLERSSILGASAYFMKPSSLPALVRLIAELCDTWIVPRCGVLQAPAG